jgi:hypothetical protein
MLIKKFGSLDEKTIEDKLIEKYNNKEEITYVVKAILTDGSDIFLGTSKKNFDEAIESYIKKSKLNEDEVIEGYVYIVEETRIKRIITKEELDPYVSAKKYNL